MKMKRSILFLHKFAENHQCLNSIERLVTHPTGGRYDKARKLLYMQLKHFDLEGQAHFVTFRTHKGLPMIDDAISAIIIDTLRQFIRDMSMVLAGYVIMPNHVHLVLIPSAGVEIGNLVGNIKRVSARAIHEFLKSERKELLDYLSVIRNRLPKFAFWQRRCFDFNCRTEKDMWDKVNYCHNNPVTKKLVDSPEKWNWSSCRWYKGQPDIALELNLPEAWRK